MSRRKKWHDHNCADEIKYSNQCSVIRGEICKSIIQLILLFAINAVAISFLVNNCVTWAAAKWIIPREILVTEPHRTYTMVSSFFGSALFQFQNCSASKNLKKDLLQRNLKFGITDVIVRSCAASSRDGRLRVFLTRRHGLSRTFGWPTFVVKARWRFGLWHEIHFWSMVDWFCSSDVFVMWLMFFSLGWITQVTVNWSHIFANIFSLELCVRKNFCLGSVQSLLQRLHWFDEFTLQNTGRSFR